MIVGSKDRTQTWNQPLDWQSTCTVPAEDSYQAVCISEWLWLNMWHDCLQKAKVQLLWSVSVCLTIICCTQVQYSLACYTCFCMCLCCTSSRPTATDSATPVERRGRLPWGTGHGSLWSSPSKSVRFMSTLCTGWRNLNRNKHTLDEKSKQLQDHRVYLFFSIYWMCYATSEIMLQAICLWSNTKALNQSALYVWLLACFRCDNQQEKLALLSANPS